jgi:hypothetical protein
MKQGQRMIVGLSIANFTLLHVIISLIGIVAGLVALIGMIASDRRGGWTAVFLVTTILTSATGFMFPRNGFTPAQGVGALSLAVLALAVAALYLFNLGRAWRWIYVLAAVVALYFNVFVLVVQSFGKIGFLTALAPTQTEPPFVIAQLLVLAVFLVLGFLAVRRFHPELQLSA